MGAGVAAVGVPQASGILIAVTDQLISSLTAGPRPAGCLGELCDATDALDAAGFVTRPSWPTVHAGARPITHPSLNKVREHHASSISETIFGGPWCLFQDDSPIIIDSSVLSGIKMA